MSSTTAATYRCLWCPPFQTYSTRRFSSTLGSVTLLCGGWCRMSIAATPEVTSWTTFAWGIRQAGSFQGAVIQKIALGHPNTRIVPHAGRYFLWVPLNFLLCERNLYKNCFSTGNQKVSFSLSPIFLSEKNCCLFSRWDMWFFSVFHFSVWNLSWVFTLQISSAWSW